jgi:hypothetical protein
MWFISDEIYFSIPVKPPQFRHGRELTDAQTCGTDVKVLVYDGRTRIQTMCQIIRFCFPVLQT